MLTDVEEVSLPDLSDGPSCLTCGRPLTYSGRGRKPKYCDDHKPANTAKRRASSTTRISSGRATGAVAKILIILTAMSAHSQCKKLGLADEHLEEQLTMTDDEADAIAAPIARWSMKSKTGAKVLGPIIENEDLVDAGVAIWEYTRRTNQILKQLKGSVGVANESVAKQKAEAGVTVPKVNGFQAGLPVGHALF